MGTNLNVISLLYYMVLLLLLLFLSSCVSIIVTGQPSLYCRCTFCIQQVKEINILSFISRPAPKNEDEMMVAVFEYIDRYFFWGLFFTPGWRDAPCT